MRAGFKTPRAMGMLFSSGMPWQWPVSQAMAHGRQMRGHAMRGEDQMT